MSPVVRVWDAGRPDGRVSWRVAVEINLGADIWCDICAVIYPTERKIRLLAIFPGFSRTVLAEADADIAMGEYRQVELSASGCKLTASVQGAGTLTATADPGRFGAVGLFADDGGVVTFKSVDVTCIEGAACQ